MRALWLAMLLLLPSCSAQAADFFVRPTADCVLNGNGTAYGCASTSGGAGAWRGFQSVVQASVASGDTLRVCGEFTGRGDAQQTTFPSTMLIVNVGAGALVTGDCSASGGASTATLLLSDDCRGSGLSCQRAFDTGAGGVTGLKISNMRIFGASRYAILVQNAISDNVEITNVVADCVDAILSCINSGTSGQDGWKLTNVTMNNCYVDCIFVTGGANWTLLNVSSNGWDVGYATGRAATSSGDMIQFDQVCSGHVLQKISGVARSDQRQAIVFTGCTGSGDTLIEDVSFSTTIPASGSVGTIVGISSTTATTGTLTVRRAYLDGYRIGIIVGSGVALNASSVIVRNSSQAGISCSTSTTLCTIRNVTIDGGGRGGVGVEMASAGAGSSIQNSILYRTTVGLNRAATGTDSSNLIFGNSSDACRQSGTPVTCGAGTLTADPLLPGGVGPLSMVPLTGSPAYRAGDSFFDPQGTTDYRGCRFDASRPSIGAFEACAGDPTPSARGIR